MNFPKSLCLHTRSSVMDAGLPSRRCLVSVLLQVHHRRFPILNKIILPEGKLRYPVRCCGITAKAIEAETQSIRTTSLPGSPANTWNSEVVESNFSPTSIFPKKSGLNEQAFLLLTFLACASSAAFASLVVAAVPTLCAMRRAARSFAKLADTARVELPSTMAAIRLSGMEISDLTLELSDLSKEITEGVGRSAQAVQAAEAGVRKIGAIARDKTMSMIEERANLRPLSLKPVVAGAAMKTSKAVGRATKAIMNIISRKDQTLHDEEMDKSGP